MVRKFVFWNYIDLGITMYTHVKRVICNIKTTRQHTKMYINSGSNYRASLQMVSRKTAVYISPLSCLTDNCNCRNPLPLEWSKHKAIALTYFIPPHSHTHTCIFKHTANIVRLIPFTYSILAIVVVVAVIRFYSVSLSHTTTWRRDVVVWDNAVTSQVPRCDKQERFTQTEFFY